MLYFYREDNEDGGDGVKYARSGGVTTNKFRRQILEFVVKVVIVIGPKVVRLSYSTGYFSADLAFSSLLFPISNHHSSSSIKHPPHFPSLKKRNSKTVPS